MIYMETPAGKTIGDDEQESTLKTKMQEVGTNKIEGGPKATQISLF